MRFVWTLFLLGLLIPASARAASAERGRAPLEREAFRRIRCLSPEGVLPAVSDLNDFHNQAFVTLPCQKPRVAMVAGSFNDVGEARRLLAELRARRDLPFGYPVVAHPGAMWLPLPGKRLVLVVALFHQRKDADAWQRRHPGFEQVKLSNHPEYVWADSFVIPLASADPVPAYDLRQAIRLSEASIALKAPPRNVAPRCRIPGDALFVFREKRFISLVYERKSEERSMFFLPVLCGARVRYVDSRSTTYHTAFWTDRSGTRRITQITEGSCGYTRYETTIVDAAGGRRLEHDTLLDHDGC